MQIQKLSEQIVESNGEGTPVLERQIAELSQSLRIKENEVEELKKEILEMEDLTIQMSKLLDDKAIIQSSRYSQDASRDIEKLLEENKTLEEYVIRLQHKIEERECFEKQLMKEYKQEIEKYKTQWIPITKHEEIVNEELAKQEQELMQSFKHH